MGLREWLRGKRGADESTPHFAGVRRLPAGENAFGVEIWDCSAFTQSMISTTGDLHLAVSFNVLRGSTGTEHRGQAVADAHTCQCALSYSYTGEVGDGALFKAEQMEDKWDIYLYRPYLFFTRSWSGQLVYRATVTVERGSLRVTHIECPATEELEFARRVVDYLIRSHLMNLRIPHPLPADVPPDPQSIAAMSFSLFGRRCLYGCYGDTTLVRANAPQP